MGRLDDVGRWFWNTRRGTYEWRESTSSGAAWVFALVVVVLFAFIAVVGLAVLRQVVITDSSTVARIAAAGDYGSLLGYVLELGQWVVAISSVALQTYWPFLLILIPGAVGVWAMRKG